MDLHERHVILGIAEKLSSITEVRTEAQFATVKLLSYLAGHRTPATFEPSMIRGLKNAVELVALSEHSGASELVEEMHGHIHRLEGRVNHGLSSPEEAKVTPLQGGRYRGIGESADTLRDIEASTWSA